MEPMNLEELEDLRRYCVKREILQNGRGIPQAWVQTRHILTILDMLEDAKKTISKQADIATQYRSMVVEYCESSRPSPMLEKLRTVDQEREKLHAKVHNSC